jgi:indolepyruvate ferredoxin oxidoreductase alpha subunit
MTSGYTGVNGGLVIIVADDPNMYSSQNEQDSRHYPRMAKLPMLEPADSAEAYNYTKEAFEISEKYLCPVLVRSVTRISHSMSVVEYSGRVEKNPTEYKKNPERWVMTPVNARMRHKAAEERLAALADCAANYTSVHGQSAELGIITSGSVYQYVREAMPEAKILKLGMIWPLPIAAIKEFAATVDKLYVVEELDRIIETELRAAGVTLMNIERNVRGELCVDAVADFFGNGPPVCPPLPTAIPMRPPNMCAGCSHRGIFHAISRLRLYVTGDIGCYTLGYMPPLDAMDSCICMGASVSMAHGFDKGSGGALAGKSVAVIGDSTFLHTGLSGLINTVYNTGHSTVVILDNRITGMTGHQPNPASGFSIKGGPAPAINLEALCRAVGVKHVVTVDPFDIERCIEVLKEETARPEPSVIITNRACIFADKSVIKPPYAVDPETCSGCRACLRIGCPAISWDTENRRAQIDSQQCTGCGLCVKLCRFGSIKQI